MINIRLLAATAVAALAVTGAAAPAVAAPPTAGPPVVVAANLSHADERRMPKLVTQWAKAWNTADAEGLAALFTPKATYTDFAFGATFTGRTEIAEWVRITHSSIADLNVEVTDAFRSGDRISVRWTFSGQIVGAPQPFSVPVSTVMEIRRGKISNNGDYYNLAEVLRQSGLPADTTF